MKIRRAIPAKRNDLPNAKREVRGVGPRAAHVVPGTTIGAVATFSRAERRA